MANSFLTPVPAAELKMAFLEPVGYLSRSDDTNEGCGNHLGHRAATYLRWQQGVRNGDPRRRCWKLASSVACD
jgi:hypothetical protein